MPRQTNKILAFTGICALPWSALCACGSTEASGANGSFEDAPYLVTETDSRSLRLELRTSPEQPPVRGVNTLEIFIAEFDGTPRDGLIVRVTPWMAAMGHGASAEPSVRSIGNGKYVADDVRFFMAGQWQLQIAISGAVNDSATPSFAVR